MQKTIRRFAFILAFAMAFPSYLCAATIEIGSGSVASGQNVVLPVFLDTADCAAVQLRLQYDDSLLGAPLVLPGNMVGSKHRLDWNAPQPGKVNLCITPEDPVTTFDQGGVLCYLIFSVDATTGTITQITEQAVATGPPQIPPTALSDINGATISPGFIHGTVTVTDQTGSLQVDLSPSDAVSDGAAWRRIGQTAWRVGGETESDVPVGDCYIEFKGIPGWIAPASQSLAINQGALSQTNAVYQPRPYYLNYAAGQGGTLSGTTSQTVYHGQNGSAVEAVGDSGYHFVEWSDGVTDNPRTDLNVTANIDVTARFALHDYLDAYYVVYSNRDSDVQPRYYENGIYLPASEGSGILKIIRQRGKTDYPEIPSVFVEGSLAALLTQSSIGEVYVTGDLAKAVALNAHIEKIVAHNLGQVKMLGVTKSASSDETLESSTTLQSGGTVALTENTGALPDVTVTPPIADGSVNPDFYQIAAVLAGVSLADFSAPRQTAVISVSPRVFRWVDADGVHIDLSLGRIPNLGSNKIEAGYLATLTARGGKLGVSNSAVDTPEILSHATLPGRLSSTRVITRNFRAALVEPDTGRTIADYVGACSPTTITLASDIVLMMAVNGDLQADLIEVDGSIALLRSSRGSATFGAVRSGCDPLFENPDIIRIMGDYGVSGIFQAGMDAGGSPDNRGNILLMQTNARLAPEARISGEAWVADRIIRLVGDTTAVDEGRLLYCP